MTWTVPMTLNPLFDAVGEMSRRQALRRTTGVLGAAALAHLLPVQVAQVAAGGSTAGGHAVQPIPPRAKRVIYLCQSGGPSHLDLFDFKPRLAAEHGRPLPPSVMGQQRLTTMTSGQSEFLTCGPLRPFAQHGQCGRWVSGLLPHTARVVDDICFIKSMYTEAINHDPGITLLNTGSQQMGHASLGAWVAYGLGSANDNLPAYLVLVSQGTGKNPGQPIFSRLWGSGYLPSKYQGVWLRAGATPVLHLNNPAGVDRELRRAMLDDLAQLNELQLAQRGDPEIETWISQYEMAFRMQASTPELIDLSDEPESTFDLYGPESRQPGTYAANCLLARRLAERGVRFIQLIHRGWDQHDNLPEHLTAQCRDTDQPTAALIADLKQRGLLDDTLVVWCSEFGRTAYSQGKLGFGRDHHGRCFTMWMAGGGVRPAYEHGETDEYGYNLVRDGVHIRDLNATILRCLGIDHRQFSFLHQGLEQKITGPEEAFVVESVLV
jgi:uncharacterized protein (DUF1501 family)